MSEGEQEGSYMAEEVFPDSEIVVSLVRQLPPVSEMESADGSGAERGNNPLPGGDGGGSPPGTCDAYCRVSRRRA